MYNIDVYNYRDRLPGRIPSRIGLILLAFFDPNDTFSKQMDLVCQIFQCKRFGLRSFKFLSIIHALLLWK